jgi:hypothetical protein
MPAKYNYTQTQISYIQKNYPVKGGIFCSHILNLAPSKVFNIARKYKIKFIKKHNVNMNKFRNINRYSAYILGLLWTDGYINKNTNNGYRIEIMLLKRDMDKIENPFNHVGNWKNCIDRRSRKIRKKLYLDSKELHGFLWKFNFHKKSFVSPDKLLLYIPKRLWKYFFRGIIDGDGCFYPNKYGGQFCITSSYEQNWNYVKKLMKLLKIKNYKIDKQKRSYGSMSRIMITKRENIIRLGDFIYKDYNKNKIGLDRKYLKYKIIRSKTRN